MAQLYHAGPMKKTSKQSLHNSRYQKLVRTLVEARREAGLSQEEVAILLNIKQSTVSKIENCERRLGLIEFIDLATEIDRRLDRKFTVEKLFLSAKEVERGRLS